MFSIDTNTLVIGISIGAGVILLLSIFTILSRFYRRCGADEALVRTGSGGNKVVIGGGVLVYPILHQLLRVSLRSRQALGRALGARTRSSPPTRSRRTSRPSSTSRWSRSPEDVLAAARSFGERNLDEHVIADLIEGKLTDALRSVAANQTFMALHAQPQAVRRAHPGGARARSSRRTASRSRTCPSPRFAMVPGEGPRSRKTCSTPRASARSPRACRRTARRPTASSARRTTRSRRRTSRRARTQLEMEQDQKQAEADQARKVAEYSAMQAAETAKAVYIQEQMRDLASLEKQRAVETARIEQEKAVAVALAGKQRAEREAQIEAEKGQQAADEHARDRRRSSSRLRRSTRRRPSRSRASASRSRSPRARSKRPAPRRRRRSLSPKRRRPSRPSSPSRRPRRPSARRRCRSSKRKPRPRWGRRSQGAVAQEAEATVAAANATAHKGEVDAKVQRQLLDAQNAISARVVVRDVTLKLLEVAPELARELMAPAKAITEIKVLQTSGMAARKRPVASGTAPALGAMSPVLKTMLEAGAAYPLLRELMSFAQVDKNKLTEKAKGALASSAASSAPRSRSNDEGAADLEPILEAEPVTNRGGNGVSHVDPAE